MNLVWKVFLCFGIVLDWAQGSVVQEAIHGEWSPWSEIKTQCSKSCGGGVQHRGRSCTNPRPQNVGSVCLKEDNTEGTVELKKFECNTTPCFAGDFTDWVECENCTIGNRTRMGICGTGPEDICTGNQEVTEEEPCNSWNISTCPSPCDTAECPQYGVCKDRSTEEEPKYECVCTMGYAMNDDKTACIRPPPTRPTKRPIPTLPAAQKTVATAVSKTASIVLIVFVVLTLLVFLVLRVFTPDRVIQMNMEIALVLAHCLLMFPPTTYEKPTLCKVVSVFIHFFFTACFNFMMLEAIHMYSLVAHVVKKDGMLNKLQNIVVGWGFSTIIVLFCVCFQYDNYGGEYHCWLQMNTPLMLGQLIPIAVISIITLTLTEAAGAAEYKPLEDTDRKQLLSAQISQRSNLVILFFVIAHLLTGMYSEYEQNLALYGTFSILNGVTGGLIFFFHCSGNQKVRAKLTSCYKSITKRSSSG